MYSLNSRSPASVRVSDALGMVLGRATSWFFFALILASLSERAGVGVGTVAGSAAGGPVDRLSHRF